MAYSDKIKDMIFQAGIWILLLVKPVNAIWMAKFEETQRSLLENLLRMGAFFKKGRKMADRRRAGFFRHPGADREITPEE